MTKFSGKGVYDAVAVGKVSVYKRCNTLVEPVKVQDIEAELDRFENAKKSALEQIGAIYEKALTEVGESDAQIFEIHMMMVNDEDYNDYIIDMIKSESVNAEYAVASASESFAQMFSSMDDSYMQARAVDVKDISNRIIACLTDCETEQTDSDEKVIICADDLAPSETVTLDKDKVIAFATAYGSSNSHTAILARNMNIPAIIGLGDTF
ncbi:MAG: phosphoenolpyruvate-utilizing N-terminal domain-containing protein, partial [Oscillospiraceae bacterium]|nr:phosphoenolpyruvate-utilizing N-terminal domain-containing protein [Oscillospiraceae bacterium]